MLTWAPAEFSTVYRAFTFLHNWEKVTKVTPENELVRPSLCAGEEGQGQRGQPKGAVHLAVTATTQVR